MMNAVAVTYGLFSFQLPVSVYESVIDIISGEVLFLKYIIYKYFSNIILIILRVNHFQM